MMIVGTILSKQEAKEIEFIMKNHVVGNRAKDLAKKGKKERSKSL